LNIRCYAHRLLPWVGHGECLACGKVWKRILTAPDNCVCGNRLLPRGKLKAEGLIRAFGKGIALAEFSGRPKCCKCAESELRSGASTVSGEVDEGLSEID
jgi:hypothetical protein